MLQEKLRELARLNEKQQYQHGIVEGWETAIAESEASIQLMLAEESEKKTKDKISALRAEINELTLAAYKETGNKKPVNGVGVRVGQSYNYDEKMALAYCRSELPQALKLDKRTFEKFIKGVQEVRPLDFVTVEEKVTPTIASDLSEYLV